MITRLDISGFKRFAHTSLQLGQLNVLTGLNGSGKSTVVQALNLINEASKSNNDTVVLSEETGLGLGHATDLLNIESFDNDFSLSVASGHESSWVFDTALSPNSPYLKVSSRPDCPPPPFGTSAYTYLAAERQGPRTTHPVDLMGSSSPTVGVDGRYVAHALSTYERLKISSVLLHPESGAVSTLRAQTEAWLSEMVGETRLEVTQVPKTNLVTLRIRKPEFTSEWVLPSNTGFGVSYCLPIVVAGLLAKPGGMLVVDGPEAHLHPAGQSAMGRFLALVASSGVQVVLETHSDHVINGIRRFVSSHKKASEQTAFFYFDRVGVERIAVDSRGKLSHWPKGFFDQINSDLLAIVRAKQ